VLAARGVAYGKIKQKVCFGNIEALHNGRTSSIGCLLLVLFLGYFPFCPAIAAKNLSASNFML
jgi:hypothetical protein